MGLHCLGQEGIAFLVGGGDVAAFPVDDADQCAAGDRGVLQRSGEPSLRDGDLDGVGGTGFILAGDALEQGYAADVLIGVGRAAFLCAGVVGAVPGKCQGDRAVVRPGAELGLRIEIAASRGVADGVGKIDADAHGAVALGQVAEDVQHMDELDENLVERFFLSEIVRVQYLLQCPAVLHAPGEVVHSVHIAVQEIDDLVVGFLYAVAELVLVVLLDDPVGDDFRH